MRIATFNINNINRRLSGLLDWLAEAQPDVVALQELKCVDEAFPPTPYDAQVTARFWRGEKTWNGVAILGRKRDPVLIRSMLPDNPNDKQSRYIEAAVQGVVIASIYAPNGNPQPGPKFEYKLSWLQRLQTHAQGLLKQGVPVVLAGDYNVVPTERDIYPTRSWKDDALLQPEARAAFARLLAQGWTDGVRVKHPDVPMFTFWDYKRNRWPRDAGLRLDHLLLSPALAARLKAAGVDRAVRGREGASDHAPAWVTLKK